MGRRLGISALVGVLIGVGGIAIPLDAAAQKAPPVILLRFIGGVAGNETLTQLLDGLMRRIASVVLR